jgi:uncharacterized membrane protein
MLRDSWWWPWWVSSLIDLGVVLAALLVIRFTKHRALRGVAAVFVVAGLVAAVLAPIVMTEEDSDQPMMRNEPLRNEPMMPGDTTP